MKSFFISALLAAAQAGDHEGEAQPPLDKNFDVPAAPALTVEEELASFDLQPGYRIECIASDPLIHDPVAISWDEFGRLWVVEMTQIMLDADGTDELAPKCAIAVLTDSDGDGVFDQRTNFLENLVLPRSICFVNGGVLVLAPPELWFVQDTDGDGVGDQHVVIDDGFEAGLHNPEVAANAMTIGIDNWVYLVHHNKRYRQVAGEWISEPMPRYGQWGMAMDAWGRRGYLWNSVPVHVDRVPPHYLVRNPNLGVAVGANQPLGRDVRVWPARVNTGVNRGYQKGILTGDGKLAKFTAATGPAFFTGTRLHPTDVGDVFVCEPAANLVRQLDISERDGIQRGENKYGAQREEFLRSSDERFRPVNLANGPDGALYIVDLYRGILQHKVYMTSFLRRQIEERELDRPVGLGRIWRVTLDDGKRVPRPNLAAMDNRRLLAELDHANGWVRKTAQRLLIERIPLDGNRKTSLIDSLHDIGAHHPGPLARMHAAWTLEGLGILQPDYVAQRLLKEKHPKVLCQWLRLSESWTATSPIWEAWSKLLNHPDAQVRWQLAHSLGESNHCEALNAMAQLFHHNPDDAILRGALLSGVHNREHALLLHTTNGIFTPDLTDGSRRWFSDLGKCIARSAQPESLVLSWNRLTELGHDWIHEAVLTGMADALPRNAANPKYALPIAEPKSLQKLAESSNAKVAQAAERIRSKMTWLGKTANDPWQSLPVKDQESLTRGREMYALSCGTCHQADGRGLAGLAPPFAESEWLQKPDAEIIKIALNGLSGPIEVKGQAWDMAMPGWSHLSDQQLADALSYVLMMWSSNPRMVDVKAIAGTRRNQ